ncbi:D-2-hydroxyacid dehydrogenase [Endozoicomonadaceae bacterium StTr2]
MKLTGVMLDADTLGADVDLSAITNLPVDWSKYGVTTPDDLLARTEGKSVVLTNKVCLREEHFRHLPDLKYIGVTATGTNIIDMEAAAARGITVTNVSGYGTQSVAQHAFSLMLALANRLPFLQQQMQNGQWQQSPIFCRLDYPPMELSGRTLLVVGYGVLGQAMAKLAEGIGMKVLKAAVPGSPSSHSDRIELEEGLRQADVVSLHCPLTDATLNILDAARLAMMPEHALLINTARGGLIDEQALADALCAGELGGAATDVLTREPPVDGNPLLDNTIPNLIVTPHCAWASPEARQRLVNMVADNLRVFLQAYL